MDMALQAHLAGEVTETCRLWRLVRRDGVVLGFTDHDRDLVVAGEVYRADTGFGASALHQATGLSVDNSEVAGALSSAAISEGDLVAGRYDGAEVRIWLAHWPDPVQRHEIFRGTLGEVARQGSAFRAELRGLGEALNLAQGDVYARSCQAVLGDARCRFDLTTPGYGVEVAVDGQDPAQNLIRCAGLAGYSERWFEQGRLEVLDGAAAGLSVMIRSDRITAAGRDLVLWQSLRTPVAVGDLVRLVAGCDRRAESCRLKFGNFLNFRGFPHLPGEDWLTAWPGAQRAGGG